MNNIQMFKQGLKLPENALIRRAVIVNKLMKKGKNNLAYKVVASAARKTDINRNEINFLHPKF